MSNKEQQNTQGELSDQQLDGVAGGQEVRKLEKVTVTAKRSDSEPLVKLEKVTVVAKRDDVPGAATVAAVHTTTKKN